MYSIPKILKDRQSSLVSPHPIRILFIFCVGSKVLVCVFPCLFLCFYPLSHHKRSFTEPLYIFFFASIIETIYFFPRASSIQSFEYNFAATTSDMTWIKTLSISQSHDIYYAAINNNDSVKLGMC